MVCLQFLVQLNSDLLCGSKLPVCTAGTANRLSDVEIVNPYLTNGFSHHYHLGESTHFRGTKSDF